jgi:hypothetical protein
LPNGERRWQRSLVLPRTFRVPALASILLLGACKASVNAEASAGGTTEHETTKFDDEPLSEASLAPHGDDEALSPMTEGALLGARHDVRLAGSAATTARCTCLAVSIGAASDAAFQWRGARPTIDPGAQLVVALGSEGISCDKAPADSLGASYWGYRVSGNDVVVVVETARAGRPVTHGAIVPKPGPSGRVLVAPLDAAVPYGRALAGSAAECAVAAADGR